MRYGYFNLPSYSGRLAVAYRVLVLHRKMADFMKKFKNKWLAQEGSLRGQNDASEGAKAEQGDGQGGEAASDVDSPAKGSENQVEANGTNHMEPEVLVKTEPGTNQESDPFAKFVIREEEEDEPMNLSKPGPNDRKVSFSNSNGGGEVQSGSQNNMQNGTVRSHPDPISTHILDTSVGSPASGVEVVLFKMDGPEDTPAWRQVNKKLTNQDGRASALLSWEAAEAGTYKMLFKTRPYFDKLNTTSFYPFVEVVFEIVDPSQHYHIPLLLSPYSFTTYKGS